MPELQRLRADHAPAVLAFELANRAYFAAFISDRGDEYFDHFTERHNAMLAEQEAGVGAFYVLAGEDGAVLGRFNLYDIKDGTAVLGYRVAEHIAGRGVATATVRELCQLAAARHGLRLLKAATTHENVASQKVLIKAGFVPAGPADPADIGGKPGTWYQRDLAAGCMRGDGTADCMRAHGTASYPDPNGEGTIVVGADGGIDPTSPQSQKAEKACQSLDNGFGTETSSFPS